EYAQAYPDKEQWLQLSGAETVVGWPLMSGEIPIGSLLLVWSEPQRLDTAQLAYISAVATMVSQALVRARIYVDAYARASVLHSAAHPHELIDAAGLDYRALYRPAEAAHGLGGDWYSVMSLPEGRTYLSVGDVIGHGLMAVEDMAQLRSAGNAYAYQGLSPRQVLTQMNRYAATQIQGEFASNFVAVFDPDTHSLSYGSAGHLPALLRRAEGDVVRLSDAQGTLLGPFSDAVYIEKTVAVGPDDVLVIYTDGLVEHLDETLEEGIAHLERVVAVWPPESLLDLQSLAAAVAPSPHADDLVILVVRFD
ncbi:MAG: PP2C family protein-serine/threonine phosphatase, partial [Mycobacterium sp.]